MARNDLIFNNKMPKPEIVASKDKDFLLEATGNIWIVDTNLEAEHNWLGLKRVDKIQKSLSNPVIKPYGKVKLLEKEFPYWWKSKNKASIFFNGASKGNPRKAGVGVLVFYIGRKLETSFS